MKKCTYCGKEYPDEAKECAIDGQPLASYPLNPESADDDPNGGTKITTIHTFISHEAAQLAASNLEAHGIKCWVSADDCGGMYPNLAVAGGVRLSVAASDVEVAIALLNTQASPLEINQIETQTIAPSPPETVPTKKMVLGQILFGIAIGVLLCLLYQGNVKHRAGHLVKSMKDRNLDGIWDCWTYYENGHVTRSEYDHNFDGKPDMFVTYTNDFIAAYEVDTDFNGIPDEFYICKYGVVQQEDIRPNGAKFAITRGFFKDGVLTEIWRGGDSNGNFKEIIKYDAFFNPISTNKFQSLLLLK